MHAANTFSLLALVGSTLAAPHYGQGRPVNNNVEVVYETVVHTKYVTEVYGQAQHYTPRPKPKTTTKVVQVKPTSTPAPVYSAPSYEAPALAPSSTKVVAPAPTGAPSTGYMAIVDEWRSKLGLSQLAHDAQLEANAEKTAREGNGQMKHQLNSGSMAQVLAPGGPEDFLHVFVGGWLCERPSLPGLDGICTEQSKGWRYDSTGHADILVSPSYSKIGCSCQTEIWSCDLA